MNKDDPELLFRNTTRHLMELFVTPEVIRRQEAGDLPKPLDLQAAQIVFYPDGRKPQVRINSEVRVMGKVKLKPGVEKHSGEVVYQNEVEGIEGLLLAPEDDHDCGHPTIMHVGETWLLGFDFIYNKGLAKKHIDAAQQFLEAAEFSLHRKNWSPFVDNLYSAAELLAKATLLGLYSTPQLRRKASHKAIHGRYNQFANLGNVAPEYAKAFNRLSRLRPPARYLDGSLDLPESEANTWLDTMKSMLQDTSRLILRER